MPRICYDSSIATRLRANATHMTMIAAANRIITTYQAQGYDLTLRQVYYQFVARDLFPEDRKYTNKGGKWVKDLEGGSKNAEPNYKWLGELLNDARVAGLMDWDALVDRTRSLRGNPHWEDPQQFTASVAPQFRVDLWATQPYRVEVWIEKDALVGVIGDLCRRLDLPYFSCRGYTSQSELWSAAQRLRGYMRPSARTKQRPQQPLVLHFGDHDPSGMNMTDDIMGRLALFAGAEVEVRRLALNMAQIREYNPPPNPTKLTDSRTRRYGEEFGEECWELDALEPEVINALIRDEVAGLVDLGAWDEARRRQREGRQALLAISNRWDDVAELVKEDIADTQVQDDTDTLDDSDSDSDS